MSNPNPPAPLPRLPRWLVWFGLLALAHYGAFIYQNYSNVAGGSDSSGYLNSARLLAAGKLMVEQRTPAEFGPVDKVNPIHFMPLGFWPSFGESKYKPTYPTGFPLHLTLAGTLVDWIAGPRFVGLFAALGAVWLCFAVGRELGLDARLAAAGGAVLGLFPVFIQSSLSPMSDTLACTWCLAAVWTALRARRNVRWAPACGAAFAVAVLVRPTNLILLPTLLILLGLDWRRLALVVLGGLPGAVWLAFYNHTLYGGALRSGYGDWSGAFAWSWGPPTAWHFLKWLGLMLPAPLLALPFVALAHRDSRSRHLLALAAWFGAITGLYLFYEFSHETWWYLRFIVPAAPALILAGLLGLEAIARGIQPANRDRFYSLSAAVLAIWALDLAGFWVTHFSVTETKNGEKTYSRACATVLEKFSPDTLVVTMTFSGAFYYYTDCPILRWDMVTPVEFARYAALAQKAGRTIAAVDFTWEEARALHEHCPGNWVRVEEIGNAVLWRLAPAPADAGSK